MSCLIIKTTDDKLMTSLIDWLNRKKCKKNSTRIYSYDERTIKEIRAKIELAYSRLDLLDGDADYETLADIYKDAFDILYNVSEEAMALLE